MTRLFQLAVLLSATLLFLVQPLSARILLPVLGGSPAVWGTCLVFFQAILLLGYLYAHVVATRVAPRWQRVLHGCVLVGASLTLPISIATGLPGDADPRWWVIRSLAATVGFPFFALAATAPLLLRWFSRTGEPRARDPYFLYAVSNAGSLLGLVAYPLLEPLAGRSAQATGWSVGFWAFATLMIACTYVSSRVAPRDSNRDAAARRGPKPSRVKRDKRTDTGGLPMPTASTVRWSDRALWIALAGVPSALLVGVTQHLATDVVSAPLLWVVPLGLYLVTYMAAFSSRGFGQASRWGALAPFAALTVLLLSLAEVRYPILPIAVAHLAAFTVLAMLCHTRLAENRPEPAHLTEYFVCLSLGGVVGSAVVALVAPVVFSSILEYPLAIAAALLCRPQRAPDAPTATSPTTRWIVRGVAAALLVAAYVGVSALNRHSALAGSPASVVVGALQSVAGDEEGAERLARVSLAIPAVLLLFSRRAALLFAGVTAGLLLGASTTRTGGELLHRERTFFGVHLVTSVQNDEWHELAHGTTMHGVQAVRGKMRNLPTAYYHPSGPIGDVVFALSPDGRFRDVAVVGLGAGAIAAYAGNGTRMDFFEVDEAVIRIAEEPRFFTYLADAKIRPGTTIRTVAVDGRVGLGTIPAGSYDLIVIDAFSSDAIPTHLLTREAISLYASRLKPRGVIAFHVSSRFFDLPPVLATLARDQSLVSYVRHDQVVPPERAAEAVRPSVWVVFGRNARDLGQLAQSAPRWEPLIAEQGHRLWTDDYTNPLGALVTD